MGHRRTRKPKKRFHELTIHDDIKYLGPLSYREFKILGWFCIVLAQAATLITLAGKVNSDFALKMATRSSIISAISSLSLPLLLFSNFAIILSNHKSYRKQLITNGGMVIGIFLVFILFFHHFILGTYAGLIRDPKAAKDSMNAVIRSATTEKGFFAFNIFVDLFLCTCFMFFLNHRPQKVFTGRKIIIFRLFALLPILYEIGSIYLKWLSSGNQIRIPFILYPLLTVKPPMTFVVFILLAMFVKIREWRFLRNGRTHEEYQEFLSTNRNSLNFSVYAAIILIVMGIVDLIIAVIIPAFQSGMQAVAQAGTTTMEDFESSLASNIQRMLAIGFGESVPLILLAPFMLLFSYTRKRRFPEYDPLIPVAAVILIVLLFFQGIYQTVRVIPFDEYETVSSDYAEESGLMDLMESSGEDTGQLSDAEMQEDSGFDLGQLLMMMLFMSQMEDMDLSEMDFDMEPELVTETVPE